MEAVVARSIISAQGTPATYFYGNIGLLQYHFTFDVDKESHLAELVVGWLLVRIERRHCLRLYFLVAYGHGFSARTHWQEKGGRDVTGQLGPKEPKLGLGLARPLSGASIRRARPTRGTAKRQAYVIRDGIDIVIEFA